MNRRHERPSIDYRASKGIMIGCALGTLMWAALIMLVIYTFLQFQP